MILLDLDQETCPIFSSLIGAKMEPSCKNLSLPRFASNQDGFEL